MPNVAQIKFGEDNPIEAAPELTDEDRHAMQQRMAAMDKLLADKQKAKYKIELFFGTARSMHKPTLGALSFWESGSMLHGGGDAKLYLCPGKHLKVNECEKAIPFNMNGYGFLVCPHCQQTWRGEQVIGEIFGRHSLKQWAELVYKYFVRLDHNCDIYVKHAPDDIRTAAKQELERQRGGELLAKARNKRDRAVYIYPLRNIIKDTSNGADVLTRFYSLLTA